MSLLPNIKAQFNEAGDVLRQFTSNENNFHAISNAVEIISNSIKNGGKVISCGNGGSMADAMHFAEELSGRFRNDRPALPAVAIADPTHITCTGNDYGFDQIFSRYVEGLGMPVDVLFAISTSGNSANVIEAAKVARLKGMKIIALTGKDGGKLKDICDVEIRVPHQGFADRIQEIHIKIIHTIIHCTETTLFTHAN